MISTGLKALVFLNVPASNKHQKLYTEALRVYIIQFTLYMTGLYRSRGLFYCATHARMQRAVTPFRRTLVFYRLTLKLNPISEKS